MFYKLECLSLIVLSALAKYLQLRIVAYPRVAQLGATSVG